MNGNLWNLIYLLIGIMLFLFVLRVLFGVV
jgi:hypothetical protein